MVCIVKQRLKRLLKGQLFIAKSIDIGRQVKILGQRQNRRARHRHRAFKAHRIGETHTSA